MDRSPRRSLVARVFGWRYAPLLMMLLAMIAIHPILNAHPTLRWVTNLVFLGMVLSTVAAIGRHTRIRVIFLALGTIGVLLPALRDFGGAVRLGAAADALHFVFIVALGSWIFQDVIRSKRITMDIVFGACCTYLLMGLGWASLYAFVEGVAPGSFNLGNLVALGGDAAGGVQDQLLYFSLVTLTTLGYGDITPVSLVAKYLAASEAVAGQLYVAIIIARMVAMEISSRGSE